MRDNNDTARWVSEHAGQAVAVPDGYATPIEIKYGKHPRYIIVEAARKCLELQEKCDGR